MPPNGMSAGEAWVGGGGSRLKEGKESSAVNKETNTSCGKNGETRTQQANGNGEVKGVAGHAGQGVWGRIMKVLTGWEMLVILLTVAPMAGYTMVQPYQQAVRAELGCGPMCIGSMTSVSSALGLFGAPLVGALSDQQGRKFALALGTIAQAFSFVLSGVSTTLLGLWLALIPSSLLSHNFTITKAVVADLSTVDQRASVLGKLGLAAGLGFMCGPVVQLFISDFTQATALATLLQILSLWAVYMLPDAQEGDEKAGKEKKTGRGLASVAIGVWEAIKEVAVLAFAAPPAAKAILFLRFALSMGFHVFYTVMSVLLKDRWNFGPNEYSNYFAFVGLVYGGSQIVSKYFVNQVKDDPTKLVIACMLCMGVGRYMTAVTEVPAIFYSSLTLTIMSLGILNNTINTSVARIGKRENVGGLMGVLDTAEKLAGVVGPTLGGLLYAYDPFTPVLTVVGGYLVMCTGVWFAFPRYLVPALRSEELSKKKEE